MNRSARLRARRVLGYLTVSLGVALVVCALSVPERMLRVSVLIATLVGAPAFLGRSRRIGAGAKDRIS